MLDSVALERLMTHISLPRVLLTVLLSISVGDCVMADTFGSGANTTFQFATSIDTTVVGGGPGTPLTVTYTFDSELANGTGPFFPRSNVGSYGPVTMQIQVADQTVSATGGGISLFNDAALPPEDSYDVRPDNGPVSFTGQLFGRDIAFFRFLLADTDSVMFDGIALPSTPDFASGADFQQINLDLIDEEFGQIALGFDESPDTPAEQRTPFSLTVVPIPEPSTLVLLGFGSLAVLWRRRPAACDLRP